MEIDVLCRYGGRMSTLLFFSIMLQRMTVCQEDVVPFYTDDVYEYNQLVDGEDYIEHSTNKQINRLKKRDCKGKMCNENQILAFLAELQAVNPESMLLIASYKDLEHLCRFVGTYNGDMMIDKIQDCIYVYLECFERIAGNLDSIDAFTQSCTPLPRDHLYTQLIAGLRVLHGKLCVESRYQRNYQNYLSCFHQLHSEYTDCAGPADWIENMNHEELCIQYKLISDCYYTKTAMLCTENAADIMKELVVDVINGITDTRCQEIQHKSYASSGGFDSCVYEHNLNFMHLAILIICLSNVRIFY